MNVGFQYFPEKLYSATAVRMTNIKPLTFFGMSNPQEIFYSIKDGNWSDLNIWETVSGRLGKLPSSTDDVYIRSNVVFDLGNVSINNLFIETVLSMSSLLTVGLNVLGNIICSNTLIVGSTAGGSFFTLYGNNNSILMLSQPGTQKFNYAGTSPQTIIDVVYPGLLNLTGGAKKTINILNVGSLVSRVVLFINYDLICNGTCDIGGSGLSFVTVQYAATNLLIVGNFIINNGVFDNTVVNANIECRGGISGFTNVFKSGTGTLSFTTNNQSLTAGGTLTLDTAVLISGAITITNSMSNSPNLIFNSPLNGDNAASTFDNRAVVQYKNATRPMITGVLQCNAAANTFKYNLLGAQDVTGGTYFTIEFGGSGVKTLQGNVVVNVTGGGGQSTTGTASVNLNGFTITTI